MANVIDAITSACGETAAIIKQYCDVMIGTGDMKKEVYDTNNNGVVDNAEKLGGNLPAYFAKQSDLTAETNRATTSENKKSEIVRLWQNASPTSAFGAQTITIQNFSQYNYIGIIPYYVSAGDTLPMSVIPNQVGAHSIMAGYLQIYRYATITATGITFGTGHEANGSEDNTKDVPIYILGFKGVQ